MYESLKDHTPDFHLFIFAFDDLTFEILHNLNLDKVTIVSLQDFETDELKNVKKERSIAEYCWTCTPSVIAYVLEKYRPADCTYIDADLFFYADPSVLISELDEHDKNVLITGHRFSYLPRLYEEKRAGRFCVQFMTFLNVESSLIVLDRWRRQCIDWCYSRYEEGKFGDQKYLDEWPQIYSNIHILNHLGGGIAPWNVGQYHFRNDGEHLSGREKKTGSRFEIVFYHFQYVKMLGNGTFDIGWYLIPANIRKLFYKPYILRIIEIEKRLQKQTNSYHTGITSFRSGTLREIMKTGIKKYFGYNIIKMQQ
jgi:hypothetical protein